MIFRRKEKVLTTDMTQGNIPRLIINFALPLMMGNLFQQLYNTVDSIIVGNYVGKEALAAIGATSPFVNTLIGFFMGFATGSGILRALGDSRRPVLFLIISSLVNVVLDLLFVIGFKWEIAGAAYATMISQAVSAFLVISVLFTGDINYRIKINELKIDFVILRKILMLGVPGGIQSSLTSFSNVFVQGYINKFGSDCVAGWACFNKIDQICLLPVQSLQMSTTTYVGQNYGAKNILRAKKGVWVSILISLILAMTALIFMQIFAAPLVRLFNKDEGVLYYGKYFLRVCTLFYLIRVINPVFAGALRGFGNAAAPMLLLLNGYVVFRQIYLYVTTHLTDAFFPVSICYPVGWAMCSITIAAYYIWWTNKRFKADL